MSKMLTISKCLNPVILSEFELFACEESKESKDPCLT